MHLLSASCSRWHGLGVGGKAKAADGDDNAASDPASEDPSSPDGSSSSSADVTGSYLVCAQSADGAESLPFQEGAKAGDPEIVLGCALMVEGVKAVLTEPLSI